MTQSKQELAAQKARIRAEKLRENLAKRKQQTRERALESQSVGSESGEPDPENTGEKSLG